MAGVLFVYIYVFVISITSWQFVIHYTTLHCDELHSTTGECYMTLH